jgi:multiple sugar transport system ATP-binding protein
MVFQSYALYPHLTVERNIAFPLRAQGVPKERHRAKIEWAAGLLGIGHLLGRRPRELSGGERQRVALARAMVREPAVFLLDEPLSNLDAKLRASARDELSQFHRRVRTTTIYVTHDQVEAMAMGDRIVVLNQGTVRQLGAPREVYDDPADTFVATFLGSPPMNLLPAGETTLGVRPEALRPAPLEGGDGLPLRVRVTHLEYLGAERLLHGVVPEGRFTGTRVVVRLPAAHQDGYAVDEAYDFAVPARELKRFDTATGRRAPGREVAWR